MAERQGQFSLGWNPNGYASAAIVLGIIAFLAVNVYASIAFRSARLDLTEQGLYTLSDGTVDTLESLEEPIRLTFYFSEELVTDTPLLQTYGARVRSLLSEYVARSNGNLILEVIDPLPFTEAEDEAVAAGLGRVQVGSNFIFFGLVGTNSIDGREVIPFFVPDREEFLEYDLTQVVSRLNQTELPLLGIVTNLTLDTGPVGMGAIEQGAQAEPYFVYEQLVRNFQIEFLEQDFDEVPADIDVLMIAHPRELDDRTLYAIDQFVLRGGRALVFVDPYSEVSLTPGPTGQPVRGYTESSNLTPLLNAWGVNMDDEVIVADRGAGTPVPANFDPRRGEITYVGWLSLGPEYLNAVEPVTEPMIRGVNLGTVGALWSTDDATTDMIPLVVSSEDSMLIPVDEVRFTPDMDRLLRDFEPTPEPYVIAARVTGPVHTAFPDGQPPEEVEDAEEGDGADDTAEAAATEPNPDHLTESVRDINVIVMADSDIFDDRTYVATANMGGSIVREARLDNDAFILNSVDYLMGTNDLLSLRARAVSDRPFEVVQDLQRQAEARYLEEEQQLRQRLEEVNRRLLELRGQIRGSGSEVAPNLGQRRQQELNEFRRQQEETRQRLREVQRSLHADIENLGFRIKAINVALIPFLIALFAMGLVVGHRVQRARRLTGRG